jgi:hypothetical protein
MTITIDAFLVVLAVDKEISVMTLGFTNLSKVCDGYLALNHQFLLDPR